MSNATTNDEIKTARERFRQAHLAKKAWLARTKGMVAERDRLLADMPNLKDHAFMAQSLKTRTLEDYAAGAANQSAVSAARKSVVDANDRVAEAHEMLEAIETALYHQNYAGMSVDIALAKAREVYCLAVSAPIETRIRIDRKLRGEMLAAFAALGAVQCEANLGAVAHWDMFLVSLFAEPPRADIAVAVESFEREHISPVIEGAQ